MKKKKKGELKVEKLQRHDLDENSYGGESRWRLPTARTYCTNWFFKSSCT